MDLHSAIASISLFEGLPKEQIDELTDIVIDQTFRKAQNIFSDGDEAAGFYVVISGKVKIYKSSPDGKEQILHIFGPGEAFGEVPMFSGDHFPANADTLEQSRLFFFARESFVKLIQDEPSLAMNMLAALSRRLRMLASLVENLSLKEVPGRLAAYILHMSEKLDGADAVELDISKGQLASLLGTIPETLSRMLAKMSSQEIIAVDGKNVRILHRDQLIELSESGRLGA
ncbi:MAG TPA: Crp/Fnr family transcriptional regulator [Dissulfurispiraceae bacterium]|nr:Crp/Fnr family transcriptional regulator [Dissulfurispiraceae bacterium]